MAEEPQAGQAVPAGQEGAQGGQDPQTQQLIQQLQQRMSQPHMSLTPLRMNPKMGQPTFGESMKASMASFVPFLGGAVSRSIKSQKEQQINTVLNDFITLDKYYEEAQYRAQLKPGEQTAEQIFETDPRVQAILGDKKKQKLLSKAFSVDWMNPEKTQSQVPYQALDRFTKMKPASQLIEKMAKMKGATDQMVQQQGGQGGQQPQQGQPQPQQGGQSGQPTPQQQPGQQPLTTNGLPQQGQQPGQGQPQPGQQAAHQFIQNWPKNIQQPDASTIEKLASLKEKQLEFQIDDARRKEQFAETLDEKRQYHNDSLQLRTQAIDVQRTNMESLAETRKMTADERQRHDKMMEELGRERLAITKELGMLRAAIAEEHVQQTGKGKMKAETQSGLRVLHVAMFGAKDAKGMVDTLGIFDDPVERTKLALSPELIHANDAPSMLRALKTMLSSNLVGANGREWVRQENRLIGAINALRGINGLPRSTQQLMDRYIMELPNPAVDKSSAEAMDKLLLVQREINAAMDEALQQNPDLAGQVNQGGEQKTGDQPSPLDQFLVKPNKNQGPN